jgi:hypothetical protein
MDLRRTLAEQDGVIARPQVLLCGHDDNLMERRLRRKDWTRVHRGVYVDHTGPLSRQQELWAAVLFAAPAVICDESALGVHGIMAAATTRTRVHVAIEPSRRVSAPNGIRVHHVQDLALKVHGHRSPPVMRLEPAVLRVAGRAADDATALALLADVCQSRRTTAARLGQALDGLPRLPRRTFLAQVLEDVAVGAYSVLEHRYLTKVERPHALPTAFRQRRVTTGRHAAYRDVEYLGGALVVELDGRLGHEAATDRWADLERDLAGLLGGSVTTRLGWGQVLEPCRAAAAVGRLLVAAGWHGATRACRRGCPAGRP